MDQPAARNLDALDALLATMGLEAQDEPRPDEYLPADVAAAAKCSTQQAQKLLLQQFRAGTVKRRKIGNQFWYSRA